MCQKDAILGEKSRIGYIDIFKGLAICLVVLQHCIGSNAKIILSFHMSLFFFASGYVSNNISIKSVLRKGLFFLKPQCFIGVTNVLWYYFIYELLLGNMYKQRWLDYFLTWFLPTMFWTLLIFAMLYRFVKIENTKIVFLLMLVCLIVARVFQFVPQSYNRLHILQFPLALFFLLLGVVLKKYSNFIEIQLKKHGITFALLAFVIVICASYYNDTVFWFNYNIGNLCLTVLSSICGCLALLAVSIRIKNSFALEWLGKNSIILYSWQFIVYRIVRVTVEHFLGNILIQIDGGVAVLSFCFSMALLIPITAFSRKLWIFREFKEKL